MILLVILLYLIIAFLVWQRSHECSSFCTPDDDLYWLFDLLSGLLWPIFFLLLLSAIIWERIKP